MKIAMVASEAAPFVKTGGLGDVMQALPQALASIPGNEVCLFLPYYASVKHNPAWDMEFLGYFDVPLAWRREYVGVIHLKTKKRKLQVYFIDNEHYFGRSGIYGFTDDGERFAYFSKAVLAAMSYVGFQPDVVHCHDWQSALVPLLMKTEYRADFGSVKSIFTIHNIEYQGKANLQFNYDVLGLPAECDETLRFDDCTNFMKAALVTADWVSTVSATYASELHYPYYAHGLSGVLCSRGDRFTGITNGIDMALYDPETSEGLAEHYGKDSAKAGKLANKLALQERVGLAKDPDVAVLAMVTRLAGHKGIDLLCYIAERLMQRRVQLVVVGTGEEKYEWYLSSLQSRFPGQAAVCLCFDTKLANLVYAASDAYLMPSKSEPCGLSQLLAMRFGSVPVVNATGGLKDTVQPYNPEDETGRGFTFQSYNADDFLAAIDRGLALYYDAPEKWARLAQSDMAVDSSWTVPAGQYMELYHKLLEG
jgi:starch synthase